MIVCISDIFCARWTFPYNEVFVASLPKPCDVMKIQKI